MCILPKLIFDKKSSGTPEMERGAGHQRAAAQWRHRIKTNWDYLEDRLGSLNAIADILIARHIFSSDDTDFVKHGDKDSTAKAKNRRFLQRLIKKGPEAYDPFTKALKKTYHQHIVDVLESTDMSFVTDLSSAPLSADETDGGAEAASVQASGHTQPTINIHHAKNVFIAAPNPADMCNPGIGENAGIQGLCPESLVVALLKNTLFHCPGRKEAMFTLEDNLCTKLREVKGKHIVSFQEHFKITFREFLDKHSKQFTVSWLDNEWVVSRVVDNPSKDVGGRSSSLEDSAYPKTPWNRTSQEEDSTYPKTPWNRTPQEREVVGEQKQSGRNVPPEGKYFRAKVSQTKRKANNREPVFENDILGPEAGDCHHQGPQAVGTTDPEKQAEIQEMCPEKTRSVPVPLVAAEKQGGQVNTEASRSSPDSSWIARCLRTEPSDTLVFKVSDEAYKDPVQLTIDIVSLWNTPDRDCAYIILGIKALVSLPHRVVGLKSTRKPEFYKGNFLWNMFDFRPRFTYRETSYEDKLVGIMKVEKGAGSFQPCIVKSDERKPGLTKNQLWYRKEGKNVVVAGSDVGSEHVKRIYSWFMQPLEGNLCQAQYTVDTFKDGQTQEWMADADIKTTGSSSRIAAGQEQTTDLESHNTSKQLSLNSANEMPMQASGKADVPNPEGSSSETKFPSELMKALGHFKKGHFILLCGTLSHTVPNLDALSLVPWIAVYDFDVCGRDTGLLAYLEQGLQQRRNTTVYTWMDPHSAVTERGTQWWSLRGRLEISGSNLSELSPMKWLQKVCDKLDKLCTELARLSQDYTILSILVLWPASKEEMKCMQKFLNELQKRIHVQPSIFLCFTESTSDGGDTLEIQNIVEDSEGNVRKVDVNLEQFCSEVISVFSSADSGVFKHQLPGEMGPIDLKVEEAAWLTQNFEVLYLQNPYAQKEMSAEELQMEGKNFFRGGSLSWLARYDMGAACFDIERQHCREIMKHIRDQYVRKLRGAIVRLLHAPGSGGSTVAQRILFDLHELTPCVHIKQCSGSTTEDVAERLRFLADHTQMPVVALLDGADEQKLQLLHMQLRHCRIIFLHVKRYLYFIDPGRMFQRHKDVFFVQGFVTKKESRNLVVQFQNHCCDSVEKKRALASLDQDVQKGRQDHQMFEYGMTVFDLQFRGVQAYVKGYLQIADHGDDLQSWQKSIGYLALVYYYAQVSLPCYFIGSIIVGSINPVFDIEDFPYAVQMLVVRDVNEGKRNYARIMHYTVAQEILEQILNPGGQRSGSGNLSEAARQRLKNFCLDFLEDVVSGSDRASSALQYVLTKTFILRENMEMDDADMGESKKKPQFSAILMDLDSEAPYFGRLQVLQKLVDICPEDANLRAHLGRFYSLCRPAEEERAEQNFKDAVRMATGTEVQNKNDLAFIYHMYGCFLWRQMKRKISVFPDTTMLDIIEDAEQTCQKFLSCRCYAPPAIRDALRYFCEIDVRLQVCRLVGRSFCGGLQALLKPQQQAAAEYTFVKGSIIEIQDLFMECTNTILLNEKSLGELQGRVNQFNAIFKGVTRELQALAEDDPLTSLRLKVTAKKLQYASGTNVVFVENPDMPAEVMVYVVDTLEQIFQHTFDQFLKDKLELDYRDWILAIRHPNFPKSYSVESVLEDVRQWQQSVDKVQSLAVFYHFVLLFLLGLGTSSSSGHDECFEEAGRLKASVQKQGRTDPKARTPQEWLGRDDAPGIKRLVSQGYVPLNEHRVKAVACPLLAVCKGTVQGRTKGSCGFIIMDRPCLKQSGSKHSIHVFFVPAHADTAMPFMKGTRVQFFLAFTQEKGYEAYNVSPLKRSQCPNCGLWVEITRDRASETCHGRTHQGRPCNTVVRRQDND